MSIEGIHRSAPHRSENAAESIVDGLQKKIGLIEAKLKSFFSSPRVSDAEKAEVSGKIESTNKKASKTALRLLIAGQLASLVYQPIQDFIKPAPKYSITETRAPDGHITYKHQDTETTEIINWITGYGPQPAGYSSTEIRAAVDRQILINHGFARNPPANFNTMSEQEVIAYARDQVNQLDHGSVLVEHTPKHTIDAEDMMTDRDVRSLTVSEVIYAPNPGLYAKLWKLQEKLGAPKIRWVSELQNKDESVKFLEDQGRSHYDIETNTIYLVNQAGAIKTPLPEYQRSPLSIIIAEDSHAQQYVNQPMLTHKRYY